MPRLVYFLTETMLIGSGIQKKIESQVRSFEKIGYKTRVVNNSDFFTNTVFGKLKSKLDFRNSISEILNFNPEIVYIRYVHIASPFFLSFLKAIKNEGIKIVLEIPTFPYDQEYKSRGALPLTKLFAERLFRNQMERYLDYIATYSDDSRIFGVDTVKIANCASVDKVINDDILVKHKSFNMIAVSSLYPWHGYDLLLNNIKTNIEFLRALNFKLEVVGDGPELPKLKSIALEKNLSDVVNFHGHKNGDELDELYRNISIGVDSLGRSRSDNSTNSSLKSKEYLMHGLPIVKTHQDKDIDKFGSIQLTLDEVNMKEIYHWFISSEYSSKDLNHIARKEFVWDVQLLKIIEALKVEKNVD
ncbi:glycosyltransferase family 4 protein [Vibrio sp. SG41-7]|uniref:glycosyltransferase n=1 Tax=Vibrio sp. SG41-7 TaxID=2760973 RepID=UPI0015FF3B1D|nr:glycosyltransferase [Vibrio sp. SG41-7]MBB1464848.1 glycosyltransferase family 4 protein [Vibrio sp. SG41-7]